MPVAFLAFFSILNIVKNAKRCRLPHRPKRLIGVGRRCLMGELCGFLHRDVTDASVLPKVLVQIAPQAKVQAVRSDGAYATQSGTCAYCRVRARVAGEQELAKHSSQIINQISHASRADFMAEVDELIAELEQAHFRNFNGASTARPTRDSS
jgi:hypothetical protein